MTDNRLTYENQAHPFLQADDVLTLCRARLNHERAQEADLVRERKRAEDRFKTACASVAHNAEQIEYWRKRVEDETNAVAEAEHKAGSVAHDEW